MRLQGNTILITGGSAGIGLALAKQFVALGNTVIITGFAHAVWDYTKRFSKMEQEDNFKLFKDELGSRLLLGLEILVLAEVVKIITTPTLASLAVLLAVVLVRTAVSWNLTLTIKGRWPWQTSPEDQESA